jgi:hypothetical protein
VYRPVRKAPATPQAQKIQPYQVPSAAVDAMIESFEKKPLKGGIPTSASAPARKHHFVNGISRPSPRICRMSCSPASAWIARPAVMKSSALKKAWVSRWNIPFAYAPTPAPRNMYPICDIVE